MKTSRIKEFYKKTRDERIQAVKDFADLNDDEAELLNSMHALDFDVADRMVENVVTTMQLPFGIATNFMVNGKEILVPFAIEEPSVVAAASNAAKLCLPNGFTAEATEPVMIGQIQLVEVPDFEKAKTAILAAKEEIISACNRVDSTLVKFGGGAKGLEVREIETIVGKMTIVHLLVDVRDAMGANAVNSMAERISPQLEELSGGKARLRILTNLAVHRLFKSKAVWSKEKLGEEAIDRMIEGYAFAEADVFRCATHNKGIMNGIDAVVIATGNDFRAVEAGAHSYAFYKHKTYKPLTKYYKNDNGDLVGEIELPLPVGTVGGATKTHPLAKVAVKILGIKTAQELGMIIASVGLAQNFAALRALANEGIQQGHMKLHAKNIAVTAGTPKELVDAVAKKMIELKEIRVAKAAEILKEMQGGNTDE